MNKRISLVNTAHELISAWLKPGDISIDATLGNGHDCLFLAQQVGSSGQVFGFDIQAEAVSATQQKCQLANAQATLSLFQTSHADMARHIPAQYHGHINVIMFNLGYLPGGDKTLITQTGSTLTALTAASRILAKPGLMTIMAYPGHPGGDQETLQVINWCNQLDTGQFRVEVIFGNKDQDTAPRLFAVYKQ